MKIHPRGTKRLAARWAIGQRRRRALASTGLTSRLGLHRRGNDMADAANQIPDRIPINVVNGVRRTLDLVPWTTQGRCVACGNTAVVARGVREARTTRGRDHDPNAVTLENFRSHFDRVVTFEGQVRDIKVSKRGKDYAVMFEQASWSRGLKLVFFPTCGHRHTCSLHLLDGGHSPRCRRLQPYVASTAARGGRTAGLVSVASSRPRPSSPSMASGLLVSPTGSTLPAPMLTHEFPRQSGGHAEIAGLFSAAL